MGNPSKHMHQNSMFTLFSAYYSVAVYGHHSPNLRRSPAVFCRVIGYARSTVAGSGRGEMRFI